MKTRGVTVSLSGNTGFTLPTNMSELGDIQNLDLSNCSLTGPFFYGSGAGQSRMTNLFFVQFHAGSIPASLGNLANLQELWLNNNQLSGNFLVVLGVVGLN